MDLGPVAIVSTALASAPVSRSRVDYCTSTRATRRVQGHRIPVAAGLRCLVSSNRRPETPQRNIPSYSCPLQLIRPTCTFRDRQKYRWSNLPAGQTLPAIGRFQYTTIPLIRESGDTTARHRQLVRSHRRQTFVKCNRPQSMTFHEKWRSSNHVTILEPAVLHTPVCGDTV